MRGFAQTFADWLPHPVYPFVGGPKDGQSLVVNLRETDRGYEPPEFWRVAHRLVPFEPQLGAVEYDPETAIFERHVYRFVPDRGSINQGHYVWVPQ